MRFFHYTRSVALRCSNHLKELPDGTVVYNLTDITIGEKTYFKKINGKFVLISREGKIYQSPDIPEGYDPEMVWLPAWKIRQTIFPVCGTMVQEGGSL